MMFLSDTSCEDKISALGDFMTILHKTLNHTDLNTLELLLNGAFTPLQGYLSQADHISVLRHNRLANGHLWPLPLTLAVTASEKRQAQLNERIVLIDQEQRAIAEVWVDGFHRLPNDVIATAQTFLPETTEDTWFVSGTITPIKKILHPAFNSIRHDVPTLRPNLQHWGGVIAVQAAPQLAETDLQRACQWLSANESGGGLLVQIAIDEDSADFHEQVRHIRQQVKCNSAHQIKLSLLPCIQGLDEKHCLLLQALVSRNYGATGFVIGAHISPEASRWLMQHRDEIGLDIIPAKRLKKIALDTQRPVRHPLCQAA